MSRGCYDNAPRHDGRGAPQRTYAWFAPPPPPPPPPLPVSVSSDSSESDETNADAASVGAADSTAAPPINQATDQRKNNDEMAKLARKANKKRNKRKRQD